MRSATIILSILLLPTLIYILPVDGAVDMSRPADMASSPRDGMPRDASARDLAAAPRDMRQPPCPVCRCPDLAPPPRDMTTPRRRPFQTDRMLWKSGSGAATVASLPGSNKCKPGTDGRTYDVVYDIITQDVPLPGGAATSSTFIEFRVYTALSAGVVATTEHCFSGSLWSCPLDPPSGLIKRACINGLVTIKLWDDAGRLLDSVDLSPERGVNYSDPSRIFPLKAGVKALRVQWLLQGPIGLRNVAASFVRVGE